MGAYVFTSVCRSDPHKYAAQWGSKLDNKVGGGECCGRKGKEEPRRETDEGTPKLGI